MFNLCRGCYLSCVAAICRQRRINKKASTVYDDAREGTAAANCRLLSHFRDTRALLNDLVGQTKKQCQLLKII